MYVNSVGSTIMLPPYLRHDFYNMTFIFKHKLYIASVSAPPIKNSWCASDTNHLRFFSDSKLILNRLGKYL